MRISQLAFLFCALFFIACQATERAPATNAVSSPIALSQDESLLVVASVDHGLLVFDRESLAVVHNLDIGVSPAHVIIDSADRALMTDKGSDSLFVVDIHSGNVEQEIPVGIEPIGLDLIDSNHVLVALSGETRVVRVDLDKGEVEASFHTGGFNATTVAVTDNGGKAYVGHLTGGKLSEININDEDRAYRDIDLEFPFSQNEVVTAPNLVRSLTVDGNNDRLVIGLSHANNPGLRSDDGFSNTTATGNCGYYQGCPEVPGGIITSVSEVDVGKGKVIEPSYADADALMMIGGAQSSAIFDDNLVPHVTPPNLLNPFEARLGGDPLGSASPDGTGATLSMHNPVGLALIDGGGGMLLLNQGSQNILVLRRQLTGSDGDLVGIIDVGDGPTGMVLTADGKKGYVWNQFDWTITSFDVPSVGRMGGRNDIQVDAVDADELEFGILSFEQETSPALIDDPSGFLASDIAIGRSLFHTATNDNISARNTISCAACHPDGLADGQTWGFDFGPRNTPQLTGGIRSTAPFHWAGDVSDVYHLNTITVQGLMGGSGLSNDQMDKIFTFIDELALARVEQNSSATLSESAERGRIIFESEESECTTCHSGELGTDNNNWDIGSRVSERERDNFQTPPLLGLVRSAPYMHDGSAETLDDLVEIWVRSDRMGKGSHLSESERADLVAYLETL